MAEPKISECSKLLAENGLIIAFAESATAGWLCSEFAMPKDQAERHSRNADQRSEIINHQITYLQL